MTLSSIEREFHAKVSAKVRLMAEGVNRFRVITPFLFEDGDHLVIVLKREGNQWVLTDEAHTFMHLSYDLDVRDLQRGTRQTIISNALTAFGISEDQGELRLAVRDGRSLKSCPPWRMFQDAWDGMIPLAARCRRVR